MSCPQKRYLLFFRYHWVVIEKKSNSSERWKVKGWWATNCSKNNFKWVLKKAKIIVIVLKKWNRLLGEVVKSPLLKDWYSSKQSQIMWHYSVQGVVSLNISYSIFMQSTVLECNYYWKFVCNIIASTLWNVFLKRE